MFIFQIYLFSTHASVTAVWLTVFLLVIFSTYLKGQRITPVMSSVFSSMSSKFWNDDVWLPPGVTWSSMKQPQTVNNTTIYPEQFAQFGDLWYPLPLALVMLLARWLVERGIFKHIGIRLGLKDHKRPYPTENTILEKEFRRNKLLSSEDLKIISKDCGMSTLQVRL